MFIVTQPYFPSQTIRVFENSAVTPGHKSHTYTDSNKLVLLVIVNQNMLLPLMV